MCPGAPVSTCLVPIPRRYCRVVETSGSGAKWKEVRVWYHGLEGNIEMLPFPLLLGCCEVSALLSLASTSMTKPKAMKPEVGGPKPLRL
jgi:hypothetical protein